MGKMHELLAVESSVTGNYNRDIGETKHVLGKGLGIHEGNRRQAPLRCRK